MSLAAAIVLSRSIPTVGSSGTYAAPSELHPEDRRNGVDRATHGDTDPTGLGPTLIGPSERHRPI